MVLAVIPLLIGTGVVGTLSGCQKDPSATPITSPFDARVANPNEVVIFFSKSRGSEIVTEGVIRELPKPLVKEEGPKQLEFALTQLLQGPSKEELGRGFFSEIPKGTQMLGVIPKDETLRVNLSQKFTEGGGSSSMQQRLKELSQTVLAVERKKPVYVDIEGQELQVLGGEGVMVDEPINRQTSSQQ
jgi:spore germination protein GerM